MRSFPLAPLLMALALTAHANADDGQRLELSAARHFTTNALDGPVALADWYTSLRGSIAAPHEHEHGTTTLGLSFEGRHYDRIRIRNTISGSVSAQTTLTPHDALELRGTVGLAARSEGDHLQIGDLIIGTRTPRRSANAGIEAGWRITSDTTLFGELSGIAEDYGQATFERDIILPAQLEPDRLRLRAAVGARRSFGPWSVGASGAFERTSMETIGDPPLRLSARTVSLETVGAYADETGRTLEIGIGAQHLADDDALFAEWRPALRASMGFVLARVELRGTLRVGYETVDTDDPLGSWLGRAEIAAAFPLSHRVVFGTGLFVEKRENLLLENEETRSGLHGELTFAAGQRADLVLRADYMNSRATILDIDKDRLEILIGLRTRL
jgi:hypothetical protein